MTQYNLHSEINDFYDKHVRLKDEIKRLRGLRDTNLDRLAEGLKSIGKPTFVKSLEQGSIPMHTANKASNNDYDIDIAVIFEKDDLPASALEARKRVAAAINEKATGFTKEPEARTNAVTVWYSDGYHVDIAVYRRREGFLGREILEHAGPDWSERDPKAITDWFIKEVKDQSPSDENCWIKPEVSLGQMRKVVRWIKCFTKTREGWNLPGGLVISTLVAECYKPDRKRDDVALYNTIEAIKNRLDFDCAIYNPTDSSSELTEKQQFLTQVKNLKKRLGSALTKLEKLFNEDCTEKQAKKAWNYLFKHEYWEAVSEDVTKAHVSHSGYSVTVSLGTAKKENGLLTAKNVHSRRILPKRIHLRFDAATNVPPPYTVKWRVENSGEEAEAANQLTHTTVSDKLRQWERTSYRGQHNMICEILKGNEVVAIAKKIVNIR